MTVHIGHSSAFGALCGYGSKKPERDIVVSQRTFFREIERRHRCQHCTRSQYPYGGSPDADPSALDDED